MSQPQVSLTFTNKDHVFEISIANALKANYSLNYTAILEGKEVSQAFQSTAVAEADHTITKAYVAGTQSGSALVKHDVRSGTLTALVQSLDGQSYLVEQTFVIKNSALLITATKQQLTAGQVQGVSTISSPPPAAKPAPSPIAATATSTASPEIATWSFASFTAALSSPIGWAVGGGVLAVLALGCLGALLKSLTNNEN